MRFLEGIKLQTPLNRESIPRERPISSLRHEERKQHSDIHGRDQLRASFHDREESDMHATNTGKGEETRWWGIAEEAVEEGEGDGLAEAEAEAGRHGLWWGRVEWGWSDGVEESCKDDLERR